MSRQIFLLMAFTSVLYSCSSQELDNAAPAATTVTPKPGTRASRMANTTGSFSGSINGTPLECLPEETYRAAFMNRINKENASDPSIVKSFKFKDGWGVLLDIPYMDGRPGTSDDLRISAERPHEVIFAKKGGHQFVKTTSISWASDSSEFYYSGEFSAELCDMTGKTNYNVKGTIEHLAVHVPPRMIKKVFKALGESAKEKSMSERH